MCRFRRGGRPKGRDSRRIASLLIVALLIGFRSLALAQDLASSSPGSMPPDVGDRKTLRDLHESLLQGRVDSVIPPLIALTEQPNATAFVKAMSFMLWARALVAGQGKAGLFPALEKARQGLEEIRTHPGFREEDRQDLAQNLLACARIATSLPWAKREEVLSFLSEAEALGLDENLRGELLFRRACFQAVFAPHDPTSRDGAIDAWSQLIRDIPTHPRVAESLFLSAVARWDQGEPDQALDCLDACLAPSVQADASLRRKAQEMREAWTHPFLQLTSPSLLRPGEAFEADLKGSGTFEGSLIRCAPSAGLESLPFPGQTWTKIPLLEEPIWRERFAVTQREPKPLRVPEMAAGLYIFRVIEAGGERVERTVLVTPCHLFTWRTSEQMLVWMADVLDGSPRASAEIWMSSQSSPAIRLAGKTDESGFLLVALSRAEGGVHVLGWSGEAVCISEVEAPPEYGRKETVARSAPSVASPGETAHFGGVHGSHQQDASKDVIVSLVGVDGRPVVSAPCPRLCGNAFLLDVSLPSWLTPGLYMASLDWPGPDDLFPWVTGVLVQAPRRGTSSLRVVRSPDWVKTREDISVTAAWTVGRRTPQPVEGQTLHAQAFMERGDAFTQDGEAVASFWAGGELHAEGDVSTDSRGQAEWRFSSGPFSRESIFRSDIQTPDGARCSVLIPAVKRPFKSTITLSTLVAQEGETVAGEVTLSDPWARRVPGQGINISIDDSVLCEACTDAEGRCQFSLRAAGPGRRRIAVQGGEEVLPAKTTLWVMATGADASSQPPRPEVILSKRKMSTGEDVRVAGLPGASSRAVLVALSASRFVEWRLVHEPTALSFPAPDGPFLVAEIVAVTDGRVDQDAALAEIQRPQDDASEKAWLIAEEISPAWGQQPKFGRVPGLGLFDLRARGLEPLRATCSGDWAGQERRTLALGAGAHVPLSSLFVEMGWPWVQEEFGRSSPASSAKIVSKVRSGIRDAEGKMTRSRLVLPGLRSWQNASSQGLDAGASLSLGCGDPPAIEERDGRTLDLLTLPEGALRSLASPGRPPILPGFLRVGDAWEADAGPLSERGGRISKGPAGWRVETGSAGAMTCSGEGWQASVPVLDRAPGALVALCMPVQGEAISDSFPEEVLLGSPRVEALFSQRFSILCEEMVRRSESLSSSPDRMMMRRLLDPGDRDALKGLMWTQNPDGGWGWIDDGASDEVMTALGFVCLKSSAGQTSEEAMAVRKALDFLRTPSPERGRDEISSSLLSLCRWAGAPCDERSLSEDPTDAEAGFGPMWGGIAQALDHILRPPEGGLMAIWRPCWTAISIPNALPLERAMWAHLAGLLDSQDREEAPLPSEIVLNGERFAMTPHPSQGLCRAVCPLPSSGPLIEARFPSSVTGWLALICVESPGSSEAMIQPPSIRVQVTHSTPEGPLSAHEGTFRIARGQRITQEFLIWLPEDVNRVEVQEGFPAGLEPAGDWVVDEVPRAAQFVADGLVWRADSLSSGDHRLRCTFTAEHAGVFAAEGGLIRALDPSKLCVQIPASIWAISQ